MSKNKKIVSFVIIIIVIAGLAYYVGLKSGQGSTTSSATSQRTFTMGSSTARGGARGSFGGGVSGQILSIDTNTLTISAQGGGSRIVFLGASTTVSRISSSTINDLTVGSNVSVVGSANSDNSINAQTIQLR